MTPITLDRALPERTLRALRNAWDFLKPVPHCTRCKLLHVEAQDIDCFCRCWEK